MAASGEMRKMQLRSVLESLNDGAGGKSPGRPGNPFSVSGSHQYIDIDIEALLYARCKDKTKGGSDPRPINSANGGSEVSRCQQLEGVEKWNRERNLGLPAVAPDFCATDTSCPGLAVLGGDTKLPFFLEDKSLTLNNQWLFEAVRDSPTNFELGTKYVWLLRYAARWSVAVRLWSLCQHNRQLVERLSAGAHAVCDKPLDPRRLTPTDTNTYDDNVGSAAWRAAFGR